MELALLDGIQSGLQGVFLDTVMPWISRICDHGEVWILLAAVLLLRKQRRTSGVAVGLALILELVVCNLFLKPMVGRMRPFAVNPGMDLLVPAPTDFSFPSGHTASSFAAAFALKAAGDRLWIPALILAIAIAFSRLYLYVHWPSDVLCGALLGALLGLLSGGLIRWAVRRKGQSGEA